MNYLFYAAKAVKLKACVTKFLHHICLLSPLPLSAWEVPEPNTLNPVSFGCPFQSFENVIVSLSSEFYFSEALAPLLYVQSSECACWVPPISSLPSFLGCWSPLTGSALPMDFWSWLPQFLDATSCYASHLHPHAYSCSAYQFLTFCLWYPQKIFHTSRYFHGNQSKGDKKAVC